MSFRFYDVLEETYYLLQQWREDDQLTKDDVLDSIRQRILNLMTHVITTPLIGTAFAYPGDIPDFEQWVHEPLSATSAMP